MLIAVLTVETMSLQDAIADKVSNPGTTRRSGDPWDELGSGGRSGDPVGVDSDPVSSGGLENSGRPGTVGEGPRDLAIWATDRDPKTESRRTLLKRSARWGDAWGRS